MINEDPMITLTPKHYKNVTHKYRREWPKYSTQMLNVGNGNCKGTDKKIVGSAKELWLEMRGQNIVGTFENWVEFYNSTEYSKNTPAQGKKLYEMMQKMAAALEAITPDMCEDYIRELVENKTHMGMAGEEMAIQAVGQYYGLEVRFSTAEEETQGIDGWIGDIPVQVKPDDSAFKAHVFNHPDKNKVLLVTYDTEEKTKCYIHNPEFLVDKLPA